MGISGRTRRLLRITDSAGILRRYLVVNGFDGALTMLGLVIGFVVGQAVDLEVVINSCLAAAIALGMSGFSSAYISEEAERKRDLGKLEEAMITDLGDTAHGRAARWVPVLVALVNGAAPLAISLLIIAPLLLARAGVALPLPPLYLAVGVAALLIFLLGILLGRIAEVPWIQSGIRTVLVAGTTVLLIYWLTA